MRPFFCFRQQQRLRDGVVNEFLSQFDEKLAAGFQEDPKSDRPYDPVYKELDHTLFQQRLNHQGLQTKSKGQNKAFIKTLKLTKLYREDLEKQEGVWFCGARETH